MGRNASTAGGDPGAGRSLDDGESTPRGSRAGAKPSGNPAGGADGDADMASEESVGDYLSDRFFIDGIIISQQT